LTIRSNTSGFSHRKITPAHQGRRHRSTATTEAAHDRPARRRPETQHGPLARDREHRRLPGSLAHRGAGGGPRRRRGVRVPAAGAVSGPALMCAAIETTCDEMSAHVVVVPVKFGPYDPPTRKQGREMSDLAFAKMARDGMFPELHLRASVRYRQASVEAAVARLANDGKG
jgi:hypothetical protein